MLTTRHDNPLDIPITPSVADFGIVNAAAIEAKRLSDLNASISASSVTRSKNRLSSKSKFRSASVESNRQRHPLIPPLPKTVRADMMATMREHTTGLGVTTMAEAELIGRPLDVYDDRGAFDD